MHKTVASAGGHSDLIWPHIEHVRQAAVRPLLIHVPATEVDAAKTAQIIDIGMHGARRRPWKRPTSGMIQIDAAARHREKELPQFADVFFFRCKFMLAFFDEQ